MVKQESQVINRENIIAIEIKRIFKVGGSLVIPLPPRWVTTNMLTGDDEVKVITTDQGLKIEVIKE